MLLFLREKQGAQETLHTDQNSNRVHGKEKRKKRGERLKRGRTRTVQFTQKETERGRKEKKRGEMHCVSLFPKSSVAPVGGVASLAHVGPLAERRGRSTGPRKLWVGRAGLLLMAHHCRCRRHYRRRGLGASQKAGLLKRMNQRCPWPAPENLRHRCS